MEGLSSKDSLQDYFKDKPSYIVYSVDRPGYALTVDFSRRLCLVHVERNLSWRHRMIWYWDASHQFNGPLIFALVNSLSYAALQYSADSPTTVNMEPYDRSAVNESFQWFEVNSDDGSCSVIKVKNEHRFLTVEASNYVMIQKSSNLDGQRWRFVPFYPDIPSYNKSALGLNLFHEPTYTVYCRSEDDRRLTIRDFKAIFVSADSNDRFQNWHKDKNYGSKVKDKDGFIPFALVNKATGQAIKFAGDHAHFQLVPFDPDVVDESIIWSESQDMENGYCSVRMFNNHNVAWDAFRDHTNYALGAWDYHGEFHQQWKIISKPR